MRKLLNKLLKTSIITLSFVYMFCMPVYADTSQVQATQSARWVGSVDRWQLSDNQG